MHFQPTIVFILWWIYHGLNLMVGIFLFRPLLTPPLSFLFPFLRWSLAMLSRLVLNSWAQVVLLPQPLENSSFLIQHFHLLLLDLLQYGGVGEEDTNNHDHVSTVIKVWALLLKQGSWRRHFWGDISLGGQCLSEAWGKWCDQSSDTERQTE